MHSINAKSAALLISYDTMMLNASSVAEQEIQGIDDDDDTGIFVCMPCITHHQR